MIKSIWKTGDWLEGECKNHTNIETETDQIDYKSFVALEVRLSLKTGLQ